MAVRVSGVDWKRFLKSRPAGWTYKRAYIVVDGLSKNPDEDLSNVADDSVIQIAGGLSLTSSDMHNGACLEAVVRNWRTNSKYLRFVVEFAKEDMIAVKEAVEKAGGEIVV